MTPELRYRQAVRKARVIANRDMRLFMEGKTDWLPCLDERKCLIEQIAAAYAEGLRDGQSRVPESPPHA